jgi:hypothetical protein
MSARIVVSLFAAAALVGLSACGERPQVIEYKQGTYQGKPDQPPFAGAPWNGNQQAWNDAIKVRNEQQNEYLRTRDSTK